MSSKIKNKTSKTFPQGGIHPADRKLSADKPIVRLSLPETVVIPLSQHIGAPVECLAKPGDEVKTGQCLGKATGPISAHIHSSVTGKVLKIEEVMNVNGYKCQAVRIEVQEDQWLDGLNVPADPLIDTRLDPDQIAQQVFDMGVVGMGGAMFPAHVKLKVPEGKKAEYLLINGVECEPFLTADHRLMLEQGREILCGIRIILKALGLRRAMIGIEDNKPDAIAALTELCQDEDAISVEPLKVWYPQGGERQLVKALVNREIPPPPKGLPIDVGCVVFNIGTVFAIYEAVKKNKPLIERVVTVTGEDVSSPGNFLVRIGTPVSALIQAAGGIPETTGKLISGGPMMGKSLPSANVPVNKGMSGILVVPQREALRKPVLNCIRCARCVSTCPLGLEPYLLMTLAEKRLFDRADQEKVLNCCECACCCYICPANRPLVDYIRLGKNTVLKNRKIRGKA